MNLMFKDCFFLQTLSLEWDYKFINISLLVSIWLICLELAIKNMKYQYSKWTINYIKILFTKIGNSVSLVILPFDW